MLRSIVFLVALSGCLSKDEKLALFDDDGDGFYTEFAVDWGGEAPWDCDDEDATSYPEAPETCDEADNDCDGTVDEGVGDEFYRDGDGDLFGDDGETTIACSAPTGFVAAAGDCDDTHDAVNPDADETCNAVDDNCVEGIDEAGAVGESQFWADVDGDEHGDPAAAIQACVAPVGYLPAGALDQADCDDAHDDTSPGLPEVCNDGRDNDCDGTRNACVLDGDVALATVADAVLTGAVTSDSLGVALATGDLNGDGAVDLAIATRGTNGTGSVDVWFGGETFDLAGPPDVSITSDSLTRPRALCTADVSGDGRVDLIVAWERTTGMTVPTYAVYNGPIVDGLGSAWSASIHNTSVEILPAMACGNAGGSSRADVLALNGDTAVFDGPLSGTRDLLAPSRTIPGTDWTIVDVDGDSVLDFIRAGASGYEVFYGPVTSTTTVGTTFDTGHPPVGEFSAADLDGDGLPEVAVGDEAGGAAGRVALFRGVGRFPSTVSASGSTGSVVGWGPTSPARSLAFVDDVDGDGVRDVVAVSAGATSSVALISGAALLAGDELVAHADGLRIDLPSDSASQLEIASGDFNGDGVGETVIALPLFGANDVGAVYLLGGRAP